MALASGVRIKTQGPPALRHASKPSFLDDAFRLAILQAQNDARDVVGDEEVLRAVELLREASARQDADGQRVSKLEAALDALRESTRRDFEPARDRADEAEARLAFAREQADLAELRAQQAEDALNKMLAVIQGELGPSRTQG
jgi:MoxR-like ATPase